MKIIIKNGHIIDPNSKIDNIQNLYIEGSSICLPFPEAEADSVIDASGRVVCPGFIDMHMHEDPVLPDGSIYADEEKAVFNCMLRMGVTTAIAGNCGENEYHPADYLDLVDKQGVAVNVGMLAGHEFFRNEAGGTDRYASIGPEQIRRTAAGMEDSLRRGCLGISYGIRYVPGMDTDELYETAKVAKNYDALIAAHIRSDAEEVFDAADEFLGTVAQLSCPVEVSHIGSMAGFGQMERFLRQVDSYRELNPRIGCDCYPYAAYATGIGSATFDEGWNKRYDCDYSVIELAEGEYKGQRCTEEIFRKVRREYPDCIAIAHVMLQDEVDMAYRHESVCLGSDGSLNRGQGHPRAASAFPRFIARYVRGGSMSLYEAVDILSCRAARLLGLERKGRLSVGADADVVIFDPERIEDRSDFSQPLVPPVGIDYVLVNGEIAARDSVILNGRLGKSVRK